MRRLGGVWDEITSFGNLCRAARRAARGKRTVKGVAGFLERLEPEALRLQRELRDGSYRPGTPVRFLVKDPKVREITAAPFRDRVVHHALVDPLEPWLDRRMVAHSFACRRGKGQHAALRHAQRLVRRHEWFLKLDVRSFFPSLDHAVVLATLARVVKDRRALGLCELIVRHGGAAGRGLPIGHLTSQWFANLVLDRMDHWLVETLRVPGYVRYMDDFVLLAATKRRLAGLREKVTGFLGGLGLALKERATVLAPCRTGLPFLGWQVYRGVLRLRPANLRRTKARLRLRRWQARIGVLDETRLADCVRAVVAHLRHGDTWTLRRRWFASVGAEREQVAGSGDRVNRGGSFNNPAANARSANRNNNTPSNRNNDLGVRPAKTSSTPDRGGRRSGTAAPCPVMSRPASGAGAGSPVPAEQRASRRGW